MVFLGINICILNILLITHFFSFHRVSVKDVDVKDESQLNLSYLLFIKSIPYFLCKLKPLPDVTAGFTSQHI